MLVLIVSLASKQKPEEKSRKTTGRKKSRIMGRLLTVTYRYRTHSPHPPKKQKRENEKGVEEIERCRSRKKNFTPKKRSKEKNRDFGGCGVPQRKDTNKR